MPRKGNQEQHKTDSLRVFW